MTAPATNPNPPARPWVIATVHDHGAGWYRYSVTGWNHNHAPPSPISWSVPSVDGPQYDLDGATWTRATPIPPTR